jgi:ubiquinone/menaquinone biosynthesis C-methylase UbiE
VLQHLDKADRKKAFAEITRLLKPGGLFVCYEMASDSWFGFAEDAPIIEEDPGTLVFHNSDLKDYLLGNIGLTHFFSKGEILDGLKGFTTVDICPVVYKIPSEESERRGYKPGTQMTFWASYAIR